MIAESIQKAYIARKADQKEYSSGKADDPLNEWKSLAENYKESNREQADHIAVKLRSAGLWFRKQIPGYAADPDAEKRLRRVLEELAKAEHDRWVADQRRQGWIAAAGMDKAKYRDNHRMLHNCIFTWEELTEDLKEYDRVTVNKIPDHLAAAGYEIIQA